MSAWTYRSLDGKAAQKIVPPCLRIPLWKGPSAESVEKHEPASDIDTAVAESLKALDPNRPIREADMDARPRNVRFTPKADIGTQPRNVRFVPKADIAMSSRRPLT